jgi:3-dehydroquinate dehydratase II
MSATSRKAATAAAKAARGRGSILVLHGPNLNLLGTREPAVYGHDTLADVNRRLLSQAKAEGFPLFTFQSNDEGALIDRIHAARTEDVRFIVINPAGFTHTSVALRDALAGVDIPFIEVHLTNVHAREAFRHHSFFSDTAIGTIVGLGPRGYEFALSYALAKLGA